MLDFVNDYSEGAHEKILLRLLETNMEKLSGYGTDQYCESAKQKIREVCECPEADIYFLVGGTQTNATVIDAILSQYEGVVAANTGHISTHEAGAIEASAHKVLAIPHKNGKITAKAVKQYFADFYADGNHEHMVFPGMVYISHPTEYGTLYSKKELEELSIVCHEYDAPLYLDGARLGYGLVSEENDVTLADIASLCDAFYIGGTKNGALFGEALVICNDSLKKDFRYNIKQKGALLAKGRLLGIQFIELFKDNLFFDLANHANEMARLIQDALIENNYKLLIKSPTNQIFPILKNTDLERLSKKYSFAIWEEYDENHTVIRICTSWATDKEKVLELIEDLKNH